MSLDEDLPVDDPVDLDALGLGQGEPAQEQEAEEVPLSPLEQLMAERGITADRAHEILDRASDEERQEREQQDQLRQEQAFEQHYEKRFNQDVGQRLAGYFRDPRFVEKALDHIRTNFPGLVPEAEADEQDPAARAARQSSNELARVKAELAQAIGAQKQFQQNWQREQHSYAVGNQLDRFMAKNPAYQKYEESLIEDMREAYDSNPGRFRNPALDVPAWLKTRAERYRKYDPSAQPAAQPKKTVPPRSASGRPYAAPSKRGNSLPDLTPVDLSRDYFSFMGGRGEEG